MVAALSIVSLLPRIYSPSKRFCAVCVTLSNTCDHSNINLLLICVYLPTNYGTEYSDALFVEAIGELEGFIQCTSFDCLFVETSMLTSIIAVAVAPFFQLLCITSI